MAIVQFLEPNASQSTKEEEAVVQRSLSRLENQANASLGNPEKLAGDVQKLMGGVSGSGGLSFIGGLKALRQVVSIMKQGKTVVQTTATRVQQFKNQEALTNLFINSAVVEMAEVSKDLDFQSVNEALAVRDEVADLLEVQAHTSDDDATYKTLMNLRAGVVRDITARSADLSRVETRETPMLTNSLLMAYQLYGDSSRETEIVERNDLALPGFVSPSQPLQVLNG